MLQQRSTALRTARTIRQYQHQDEYATAESVEQTARVGVIDCSFESIPGQDACESRGLGAAPEESWQPDPHKR